MTLLIVIRLNSICGCTGACTGFQLFVGGLRLLMELNHLCNPDHVPLIQTVKSSTSSTLVSVWMTVLTGTFPASSSRSACAATLTVPCVTARVLTTAKCVATREPSVTTESVCLSAAATLTTTRPPTNAEVGVGGPLLVVI